MTNNIAIWLAPKQRDSMVGLIINISISVLCHDDTLKLDESRCIIYLPRPPHKYTSIPGWSYFFHEFPRRNIMPLASSSSWELQLELYDCVFVSTG